MEKTKMEEIMKYLGYEPSDDTSHEFSFVNKPDVKHYPNVGSWEWIINIALLTGCNISTKYQNNKSKAFSKLHKHCVESMNQRPANQMDMFGDMPSKGYISVDIELPSEF